MNLQARGLKLEPALQLSQLILHETTLAYLRRPYLGRNRFTRRQPALGWFTYTAVMGRPGLQCVRSSRFEATNHIISRAKDSNMIHQPPIPRATVPPIFISLTICPGSDDWIPSNAQILELHFQNSAGMVSIWRTTIS
ncbi:unnamed protein product [Rhizoctonia solani]|uniref:Uncharacterized protein n=1 Tax=Rhizoctonia solani TaxID=456999 RepID=A0A8H2XHT3_9AGAM|nr:unnamed protein product [Rhizoctonia solani]